MQQDQYSKIGDKNLKIVNQSSNFTNWLYEQIKPYIDGKILEIGSGIGTYSAKIIADFPKNKIVLSDIDPNYLTKLKKQWQMKNVFVDKLNLNSKADFLRIGGRFDTIIALNILEHISNDLVALQNLRQKLNPNGQLILLVPAYPKLFNCIDQAVGHFRRYKKKDIINKANKSGLKIQRIFYFNFFAIIGWVVNGFVFNKSEINEQAMGFFNYLVPSFKFVENNILKKRAGMSLIAILKPKNDKNI
jgi:SAM-dependent methyltransferase